MTAADDTAALTEQIARALYARGLPVLAEAWDNPGNLAQAPHWRDAWRKEAAAVIPIIRKAQADALRSAAEDMGMWGKEAVVVAGDAFDEDTWVETSVAEWLTVRADGIEEER